MDKFSADEALDEDKKSIKDDARSERSNKEKQEQSLEWKRFFIREEFLNLLFQKFGISPTLSICRKTNFFDLKKKQKNEIFHFAIVRYTIVDEYLLIEESKADKETIEKHRINLIVYYL